MTTNANAPVEHEHRDDAAKMLGFRGWHQIIADYPSKHEIVRHSVNLHAQALANLEAARAENAAKDEAMGVFKADVSDACQAVLKWGDETIQRVRLTPFIIPPTDPVAEALKAVLAKWHSNELEVSGHEAEFFEALAELKSRLPLGGAK